MWLLPPKEKVLAREFCKMIQYIGLVKSERIIYLSVKSYLDKLSRDGKTLQINTIKNEMKLFNPILSEKLFGRLNLVENR